jgi:AcrR family transcriptional regulator
MTTATKSDNRLEILRAAERLFATHGIDGVSLREINREAGQRNTNALQYHFGDRNGLLRAIVDRHRADTEPRRHALLDQYEARGTRDARTLADALVLPLVAKLADPDGGRDYLRIQAEIYTRAADVGDLVPRPRAGSSIHRWHRLLDTLVPDVEKSALHTRFAVIRFAFVEIAHRAMARPRRDDRLFVSHLGDLVTALLTAEPSPATQRLLAERRRARRT